MIDITRRALLFGAAALAVAPLVPKFKMPEEPKIIQLKDFPEYDGICVELSVETNIIDASSLHGYKVFAAGLSTTRAKVMVPPVNIFGEPSFSNTPSKWVLQMRDSPFMLEGTFMLEHYQIGAAFGEAPEAYVDLVSMGEVRMIGDSS